MLDGLIYCRFRRSPLIFISIFLIGSKIFASTCSFNGQDSDNILKLKTSAESIDKATQIELARQNPADFCERNMILRYINANPRSSQAQKFECVAMSGPDLEKFATRVYEKELDSSRVNDKITGWLQSVTPTQSAKYLSLLDDKDFVKDTLWQQPTPKIVNELYEKAYQEKLKTLEKNFNSPAQHYFKPEDFDDLKNQLTFAKDSLKQSFGEAKICSDLSMAKAIQCTFAFRKIWDMAKPAKLPFYNYSIALTGVWQKVLSSDKQYSEGLRLTSLKLIEKLKAKNSQGSNIFDDLKDSFQTTGLSPEQAENASYEVLALYGNGGANLGGRAFAFKRRSNSESQGCLEANSICHSLDLIGKAIPLLDYLNTKSKQPPYSYPKGIEAQCNTNKSYHFWMSAYLARQLRKEGSDPKVAGLAAYAAEIGYQVNRYQGVHEVPFKIGIKAAEKSSFDPILNIMRADLAYAKAGADFGATGNTSKQKISIDKNLVRLLQESPKISPPNTFNISDDLQRYYRFTELLVPGALISNED